MEGSPFLSFYVDIEFLWKIFLFVMVGIAAVSLIYAGSGIIAGYFLERERSSLRDDQKTDNADSAQ
jgi:hypothetical protein